MASAPALPQGNGEQPHTQDRSSQPADEEYRAPGTALPEHSHGQAVRFSSVNQEIEPTFSLQSRDSLTTNTAISNDELSPEAQAEIRTLSKTLQDSHLQHRRMSNFAFEPVSLPVSRVPSNDPNAQPTLRDTTGSLGPSPKPSPPVSSMHTPPLTPAATLNRDGQQDPTHVVGSHLEKVHPDPAEMAPPVLGLQKTPPPSVVERGFNSGAMSSAATSRPSSTSDLISTRPTSLSQGSSVVEPHPRNASTFTTGPSGDSSFPPSREGSPTSTPAPGSGTVTPPTAYSRPFTPVGDRDDPYARSKRPPQTRNLDAIDARFVFGSKDPRRRSAIASATSATSLPRSSSGSDLKSHDKHQSTFSLHTLAGKKDHYGHLHDDSSTSLGGKQHGSMTELKRFFRFGQHKEKRSRSPAGSMKAKIDKSGSRTPPHQLPPSNVPFADDHGLETKYGKFGKVLGSGAGGSVRLMKRSSDGVTFAVKQFRDRHTYETEREYAKKVTAEFCIGSTLHHGNIIETLDIVHEKGHWYEVMEFAPYDLFAIVMTGKMSKEEIACSFLQIFSGVLYLHSMGLAHRDLKLDNVVVNEHGIMKLIDFGSAAVFRYPFENDIVLASGVVGSDPYLAPEVYDNVKYDPQPADIWSLAIIFACMSLRRFPWKAPRLTDNSYKLFVSPPTPGTPSAEAIARRASEGRPKSTYESAAEEDEARRRSAPNTEASVARKVSAEESAKPHRHHRHHREKSENPTEQAAADEVSHSPSSPGPRIDAPGPKQEVIRGPWRLLRLLPRESRAIMGKMLEVNPKKRATLEDMMEDPWIAVTPVCRQLDGGTIVRASGHEHTLEPGTTTTNTPATTKK